MTAAGVCNRGAVVSGFVHGWAFLLLVALLAMSDGRTVHAAGEEPFDLSGAVLADMAEAIDGGHRNAFLAVLRGAAVQRPEAAPAVVAAGCLLAPWMGELVAGTVLRAVPDAAAAAPVILAAALVALEGRRAAAVGTVVRRVAPGADTGLLEAIEGFFAEALAAGTPAAFIAAQAHDLPTPLRDVLARGRAANARGEAWLRLWEALPPVRRPAQDDPETADAPAGAQAEGRQDPILESRFRVPSGS